MLQVRVLLRPLFRNMKPGDKVIIKCRCGVSCDYKKGVLGKFIKTMLGRRYAIIYDESLNRILHEDFMTEASSIRKATKKEIRDKEFIISVRQPDLKIWNDPEELQ